MRGRRGRGRGLWVRGVAGVCVCVGPMGFKLLGYGLEKYLLVG